MIQRSCFIVGDDKGVNFQLLEMSRSVPPPLAVKRGVWEKEKLLERAAGVALSSGLIQVSVRAMRLRPRMTSMEVMKSALLSAD